MSEIFKTIVRVPKKESAYFYFQLEANEGLCFYSTIEGDKHEGHRDIIVQAHPSLKEEVVQLLNKLGKEIELEFID
ncbi:MULTISPECIES: DUF4911 domain-containing protein [Halobacteriovorax]|uniref:DUF4911 domain-containing protein n=1 Tax=Halobacteriovorax vibrionivorans TaxID=2152716 RepID=A0ABY0IIT1_9BACT|nr:MULTISPECIES: DUF4911 domain-containing protein [Halobacteriovorax]RZF22384.1 DUF4911 domain-containing protein [Halobacteriovorax vibrionivorans]TGD48636.1 DUF4911 domain-containing protein [Halobacteriovorax sp. Y22]